MNRRNIFRLAICAVAASAMEVFGMKEVRAPRPLSHEQIEALIAAFNRLEFDSRPASDFASKDGYKVVRSEA